VETEKRVVANYMRLQPEADWLDAAQTEGRGEGLLYFFNRYSFSSSRWISPRYGHSRASFTKPARTGFASTYLHFSA